MTNRHFADWEKAFKTGSLETVIETAYQSLAPYWPPEYTPVLLVAPEIRHLFGETITKHNILVMEDASIKMDKAKQSCQIEFCALLFNETEAIL